MDRRQFLGSALAGTAALQGALAAAPGEAAKGAPKKARMKAVHQSAHSDADLRVLAALGVNHLCSDLPSRTLDEHWSVEGLSRLREHVESFGIRLEAVPLPLSSSPIERSENPRGFLRFQETFPDDGDVDMIRAMRVYKEVGYDGMIMPDHAPVILGDTGSAQAFAFAFGYIQALIQLVSSEA